MMLKSWALWVATAGLASLAVSTPAHAGWTYRSSVDRMTDERVSIAIGNTNRRGAAAVVRCTGGYLETYLVGADFFDLKGADVRWRFDKKAAEGDYWGTSTDGDGVFSPYPGIMAREMAAAGTMVFEIDDFRGSTNQYIVPMAGSGAAIGRVLTDCGLPLTDPRASDPKIWRRVIDDLDKVSSSEIRLVQQALIELGYTNVTVTGRHDLATYRAASAAWVDYWNKCEQVADLSPSCTAWRRRGGGDNYPEEFFGLLSELLREEDSIKAKFSAEQARRAFPDLRRTLDDPKWQIMPNAEDLASLRPAGLQGQAAVELDCKIGIEGVPYHCNVVSESPEGRGLGDIALRASTLYRRIEWGKTPDDRERIRIEFPEPAAAPTAVVKTAE